MTDGSDQTHLHTDDDECAWCYEQFEEGDVAVTLAWEFPSSGIVVVFCSDECATEWDCSKSRKDRQEVILHV